MDIEIRKIADDAVECVKALQPLLAAA